MKKNHQFSSRTDLSGTKSIQDSSRHVSHLVVRGCSNTVSKNWVVTLSLSTYPRDDTDIIMTSWVLTPPVAFSYNHESRTFHDGSSSEHSRSLLGLDDDIESKESKATKSKFKTEVEDNYLLTNCNCSY